MRFINEFRNSELATGLITSIKHTSRTPSRLMEFCGGHTVTIFRNGIRQVLPPHLEMVSGPGCPVCVTANADIDKAIALSRLPGAIIATFGDMLKVPGSRSSLQEAQASGADVRMVYSTMDAIVIARENRDKSVIFLGIGFETTAPTIAASITQANKEHLHNYYLLSLNKLSPPAIRAILDSGESILNGLICPGHVSTITGSYPWGEIAREYHIPCVISGFEPLDILQCIQMLVSQIENGVARVEIAYRRGVRPEGNLTALKIMETVFEPAPANWRGIGNLPGSGLKLKKEYQQFDAEVAFDIPTEPATEASSCICGDILRGTSTPEDCSLFATTCTPEHPVGPCMVSSEGTCSAYYLYRGS
ncbi:MAG: hydrogenase formation protein HypD, partial [Dehalococcoidales bacterium]